jgi:uncharacterized protein (DUF58 family)
MWKHFGSSIGLLTIAMMAALYSSSATRDGRMLGSAVSGFIALAIAVIVGIKFVPRLASHVDWEWLPFKSHYQVTLEGWIYLGAITIVIFAAINTANNLLYMVLSAMLAVLALSGVLSALNFRQLRISLRVPSHCYAGEAFPVSIQVNNEKRVFPTLSISFGPAKESPLRFSTFYFSVIRRIGHVSQSGQALLTKRGRYTISKVKVASRYPFGFFLKYRNCAAQAECICYPEILTEDQLDLGGLDLRGTDERFERGSGHDLYMIRNYVPSDSARQVHWKASAKTATLKTREYAAEASRQISVLFDRFGSPAEAEAFERLVSSCATTVHHLLQSGIDVHFVADGWNGKALEPILEYLALVEMSSSAELPHADDAAVRFSLSR